MKKIFLLGGILAFITSFTLAQQKQLSMEDAFLNVRTTLAPQNLKQLGWIKGTDDLSYTDTRQGRQMLVKKSARSNQESELLDLDQLNKAGNLNLASFPAIRWISATQFAFAAPQKELIYDLKTGQVSVSAERNLPKEAANQDLNPKQNLIAFTINNNLFITDGKQEKAITNDSNEHIVNGQSVHRQEFGINKGTFWSPKGNYLAFYRMDETMVADYPVIDWTARPAKNTNVKYPMAGEKSHEVTLGVYSVATGKIVFLKTGEPKEQYLTNIAWSPDEAYIYIAVLNRDQNHMKLNRYNAQSGEFEKTLFEETDEKYTEPMHPMVFVPGNPEQFIWQSERDGYNHLYLYNSQGKLIRQLTKGKWVVTNFEGFDPSGKKAFFTSTISSPITRDFCSVELKSAKIIRITSQEGTHAAVLNDQGTLVLDQFSNQTTPRQWQVYATDGKKINTLFTAENPLKDYQLGEMNIFTIKNDQGDDLYCRLYKPVNFDASKKFPVVVYQYGGPHAQMINNTWNGGSGDLWFQYLAQRGFVVFTLDNRGSYNRGKAFEQAIFRHLGDVELQDQLKGVAYLKNLPYIDASRMGLMGWSYGGFLTTSMMTRYPGVFKAAVAGGPVIDWSYYEIMYGERYMDTPEQNPEGYKNSNVINHLDNLSGKLLVIHGAQDATVVWQHSMMLLKAAVDKGKQIDYMVYPGHEH
ncbi:MAG TPA: S9 family peptidase, partial [Daejeonella sp.]|nr:S9 family peptidase [Daejeonella sp.]